MVDCCLDFCSLEIQLGELFLDEVCFFGSSVFSYVWLIVRWCIVLLLHCLPGVLSGLSVHLPFCFFPLHGYAMNRGGVLVVARRYPKYSRLT